MADNVSLNADEDGRVSVHQSRDWSLFNVVLLGITFLFLFTAFSTCSMVETLVLEGAKNGTDVGNGYTSLSIVYGVFAASNWIAPPIVALIGSKWSMFLGSCLYCLFIGLFLRPMAVTLYIASALVGIGAAVIWTAQGGFLAANSSTETITRNTGIFWALFQGGLLFGNIFVYFKFKGETVITESTRTTLFLVLTTIGVIGTLLMIAFRKPPAAETNGDDNSLPNLRQNALDAVKKSFKLFCTKEMLLLFACFAFTGLAQTFWGAVFITSVGHIGQFGSTSKQLTGLCGVFIGVGEILGGLAFGILGHCTGRPRRSTVILFGFVVQVVAYYIIFITFPAESPLSETEAYSYYRARPALAVFCAFLLGLGDSSFNTQIYPIIRVLFPDDCSPASALFKFIQSLASAISFVYSQHLLLQWNLLILVTSGAIGSMLFFAADRIGTKLEQSGYIAIRSSE